MAVPFLPLSLLLVGAMAWQKRHGTVQPPPGTPRGPARRPSKNSEPPATPAAAGGEGWAPKSSSVILDERMSTFIARLDRALPFKFTVTDGIRTAADQANRLKTKIDRGEDLHALYQRDDLLDEILAVAPQGVEAMARVIEGQVARGDTLSPHQRRDGVDVRTKDLTPAQIQAVIDAAEQLGAEAVLESDHLHLQHLG